MYEMNTRFVIPWSKGTGCPLTMLMSWKRGPEDAQLMISHVCHPVPELIITRCLDRRGVNASRNAKGHWLNSLTSSQSVTTHQSGFVSQICGAWAFTADAAGVFSNYQPEDGVGPKLKDQLAMNPFACVIQSTSILKTHGGVSTSCPACVFSSFERLRHCV